MESSRGRDYRCDDRKNVGELRGDIDAITSRCALIPSFIKPRSSAPNEEIVQPGDVFEDTAFQQRFEMSNFTRFVDTVKRQSPNL